MSQYARTLVTTLIFCLAILVSGSFVTFETNAQGVTQQPATAAEWRSQVNGGSVRIITKGLGCTCSAIASDMSRVLNNMGQMRVLPVLGRGSLQGMADVLYLNGIDLSIVQSDVLAYIERNNIHSNIKSRVRYVTKLYNSELHLVAGPDIKTVQDLRGKVVSYDVKGRGAFITAQNVFDSVGVEVRPVYLERDVAIEKVQKGEIAAAFVVTGKPAASMQRVKPIGGIHLIPIKFSLKLSKSYFPTKLTHEEYPNLIPEGQTIPTISVGEVLAVYNWAPDTARYKKLSRFVSEFFDNFAEFQKPIRHPKWKEVNLAAVLPGWTRFAPAEVKLKQIMAVQRNVSSPDERAQFASFVRETSGTQVSKQEMAELYKKFNSWLKKQP
jgi:TRAP transporter TAXI family solute receptor